MSLWVVVCVVYVCVCVCVCVNVSLYSQEECIEIQICTYIDVLLCQADRAVAGSLERKVFGGGGKENVNHPCLRALVGIFKVKKGKI